MKKVRWGLVSTAAINSKVIPAIRLSKRSVLNAVASRDQNTAIGYAQNWDIPFAFSSYSDMYDSGTVDAVYISLPNHLHAEWTIRALQSGLHVLCEKPFALTIEDVDAMISASLKSGMHLAEAFMYYHHPQTKIAGDMVRSGDLGVPSHATGTFTFCLNHADNVRLAPEMGGGSLWDVGVYPISLAQYLFGNPPIEVFGMQRNAEASVDVSFFSQLHYPGGEVAQISSGFQSEFHNYFELTGSDGRLVFTRPFNKMERDRHLIFYPKGRRPKEIPVPAQDLYLGEIEDMVSSILDDKPNSLSLVETRNHIRTALALYESASTGLPVKLHI